MKFASFVFVAASFLPGSSAQCNVDDHHPENGGFFFVGVAGESDTVNLDSSHGQKLPNATWASGIYYPYGETKITEGPYARPPCNAAPGCPQYLDSHTCSLLLFCPPEGHTTPEIVYQLPNFEAVDQCDFSEKTAVGIMNGPDAEADGCYHHVFEEDHEQTVYFFASEEGCAQGQKIAVKIEDFTMTADECKKIGLTTPRIRNCDCRLQKKPSTLGEPCRTAFSDQCQEVVMEGDCCETGTCLSIYEDYSHPEGKAKEDERLAACDDAVPGLCYNEDGKGTDTNREGSTNCCTETCSSCGIRNNPLVDWKTCTGVFDAENKTATCGFLSRYDRFERKAFQCDFSKCNAGDYWHPEGEAFQKAFGLKKEETPESPEKDASSATVTKGMGLILLIGASIVM